MKDRERRHIILRRQIRIKLRQQTRPSTSPCTPASATTANRHIPSPRPARASAQTACAPGTAAAPCVSGPLVRRSTTSTCRILGIVLQRDLAQALVSVPAHRANAAPPNPCDARHRSSTRFAPASHPPAETASPRPAARSSRQARCPSSFSSKCPRNRRHHPDAVAALAVSRRRAAMRQPRQRRQRLLKIACEAQPATRRHKTHTARIDDQTARQSASETSPKPSLDCERGPLTCSCCNRGSIVSLYFGRMLSAYVPSTSPVGNDASRAARQTVNCNACDIYQFPIGHVYLYMAMLFLCIVACDCASAAPNSPDP